MVRKKMGFEVAEEQYPHPTDDIERIREEIRYIEAWLDEIGHDGDCAYEKAMVRFYQERLQERRRRLVRILR